MEKVHLENASRLASILEEHGWPDAGRFGADAQDAAWLILMHSISRPDLMRRGLGLLRVDDRRAAVGLPPLAEHVARCRNAAEA